MACLSATLLCCYTAISTASGVFVAARPHLPANFLFPSTTFANAQHSKFPEDIHAIGRHNITNGFQ
jgi:hypothetical protein